jgi:amino acid transporter
LYGISTAARIAASACRREAERGEQILGWAIFRISLRCDQSIMNPSVDKEPVSLQEFGYQEQLRRVLTTKDLIIYGMIFMVPIAPYSVYGFVWNDAKGMVPLAYLLGRVGMLFTALSYAAMSRAFPLAGSVYTYAQRGLHETAGFFSGWLILLDYILVPSLLYLFSAAALRPVLPAVPAWIWLCGFISFNALVNLIGIQYTARVNRYMLAMELATLGLFLVLGMMALYGGAGAGRLTLKPIYDPAAFSFATVAGATSIAVLSFLGFDGISTLSEENSGKEDAVGRATLLALVLVGALFMLQTWVATDLARGMRFASVDTAFYEVAERAGGAWLRLVTIVAVVLASAIANAMAAQAAVARILFAMARDGKLPAVLAKVHPRFKTPYVSTLAVACVSMLVGLLFSDRIDDLTRIVNFGALTGFVLLHLSVINHYFIRRRSGDWIRHFVFPLTGLAVILYVLYEMDRAAKALGGCWIAIGILYFLVLSLRAKRAASPDVAPLPDE